MKCIETEKTMIRSARRKFAAMATTNCLGAFNDNFFKQAVLLIALSTGFAHLQGPATVLFALPFILFSAYAGWVADRFAKRKVVIASKAMEVAAMMTGAYGLLAGNWECILAMVFMMGAQSAFFSPALNGSIPELYPKDYVPKANALLKLVTTLAILAGIALAGVALDAQIFETMHWPSGYIMVVAAVLLTALVGFAFSFGVHSKAPTAGRESFPWTGPLHSLKILKQYCKDRELFLALAADCFFYFVASIAILTINAFGLDQLGLSRTATSLMSASLMIGICLGSLVVAQKMSIEKWSRFLVPSALGMGAGLFFAACSVFLPEGIQKWTLAASLVATGVSGGIFIIPVTSFLQVRPAATEKGKVLASANFCGFISILIAGVVFSLLDAAFNATGSMMILSGVLLAGSLAFAVFKPEGGGRVRSVLAKCFRTILALRYRVEVKGMNALELDEKKPILFLPNHPALIDPVIVMSHLYRRFQPRPLSDGDQANKPLVKQIMKIVNPIILPSPKKNGRRSRSQVREAMDQVVRSLNNGEQVILYPSGQIYRSKRESLASNSAVELIVREVSDLQIVPVRTTGLWGSGFSWAHGGSPSLFSQLFKYVCAVLCAGVFFLPKREVCIEVRRDDRIADLGDRKAINAHLEAFYNREVFPNTHVPYFLWKGTLAEVRPEPEKRVQESDADAVSATIRKQVLVKLEKLSEQKVNGQEHLANDLGLDSLTIMECVSWLEAEYGVSVEDNGALVTANDCILAAAGKLQYSADEQKPGAVSKVPAGWLAKEDRELSFAAGSTIASCFLEQLAASPNRVVFCDQISGAKTYRDVATALFVLRSIFRKKSQTNLGIMLPASASAAIAYLAALFSGKTPVMFNWTSGVGNMAHGIDLTETGTIVTARKLYERIEEQQGVDLSSLKVEWVFLEDIASQVTLLSKISAFARGRWLWRSLKNVEVSDTAAILFTSGSEAKPKAVPLTHANILCNLRDFIQVKSFSSEDKLLGMLPPFHSLGLVGTIILPICSGLRTVYHANPTESALLARIIGQYQVTTTIGTPTFIDGILQSAQGGQLESLELIMTGAEKCPAHVCHRMLDVVPGAVLCEGYGITECSPLVSINSPEQPEKETIGKVLPSIEYRIVHPESGSLVKPGEKGVLLLRGKSIFQGYLGTDKGKGFREYQGKRWYDSGDFVKENSNGNLVFCGRQKRFVKLAGEMISLPAIETVLLEKYLITDSEGQTLAVEADEFDGQPEITLYTTVDLDRENVNKVIRACGLSPLHNIRKMVKVKEIPVLGSGKTDYRALSELAAV